MTKTLTIEGALLLLFSPLSSIVLYTLASAYWLLEYSVASVESYGKLRNSTVSRSRVKKKTTSVGAILVLKTL